MKKYTLIATQSAASDVTTAGINLGDADSYSIHAVFTGSDVVGTLGIYGSNDGTNYTLLQTATNVTASGSVLLNKNDASYQYVRAFWDYTSGTGNITVTAVVKFPGVTVAQG
jgi:hypothetical protein